MCPAQLLGPGHFDVISRPGGQYPYRRELGYRADDAGVAVCLHPYRVGMPPGRYASAGAVLPDLTGPPPAPDPEARVLPTLLVDLEGWMIATLRVAEPDRIFHAVARAEREALQRFSATEVVATLRRVLSTELARH